MFSKPLTKRQLGLLLVAGGVFAFLAIIAVDVIDIGRQGGIGPAQRIALGLTILIALAGVTLLPIKNALA